MFTFVGLFALSLAQNPAPGVIEAPAPAPGIIKAEVWRTAAPTRPGRPLAEGLVFAVTLGPGVKPTGFKITRPGRHRPWEGELSHAYEVDSRRPELGTRYYCRETGPLWPVGAEVGVTVTGRRGGHDVNVPPTRVKIGCTY
jgi:hypothetical protein